MSISVRDRIRSLIKKILWSYRSLVYMGVLKEQKKRKRLVNMSDVWVVGELGARFKKVGRV